LHDPNVVSKQIADADIDAVRRFNGSWVNSTPFASSALWVFLQSLVMNPMVKPEAPLATSSLTYRAVASRHAACADCAL